ncbi:MAG: acetylglutamate kinase [Bacillota bacterium]|nr:acetylglutamate kinase [Bacillota bacterium]
MFSKGSNINLDKANVLIQALPYIQKFNGKTIVVKYGGNAMINEDIKNAVIRDIVLLNCVGIKIVMVHGGGPEINGFLNKIGKESKFVNGLRVTDEETMDVVQMVLSGKVNKDLVALIGRNGGQAIGLCGVDAGLFNVKKHVSNDGVDLGYVGDITNVNESVVRNCLDGGYIPIISTIALGQEDGKVYNINADTAAAELSVKLNAEKLILLTDVPGLLRDRNDENSLISEVKYKDIPKLIDEKIISGGMIPKIECCTNALKGGVKSAHIIDGRILHSILLEIFSQDGVGTMLS